MEFTRSLDPLKMDKPYHGKTDFSRGFGHFFKDYESSTKMSKGNKGKDLQSPIKWAFEGVKSHKVEI